MEIVVFGGYGQLGLIFQELNLKEFDLLFFKENILKLKIMIKYKM